MPLPPRKPNKTAKKSRIGSSVPVVEKSGKKVSKKGKASTRGGERTDCCSALVASNTTGIVYSDGDSLQILPFPAVDSTLQYINGNLTWVNNN